MAVDRAGNIYTIGVTTSSTFPTANAMQPQLGGSHLRTSKDQGKNWTSPSFTDPVYSVAGSPLRPNTVFIGTSNGLFKSADAGVTWAPIPKTATASYYALMVDPVNPDLIYAATSQGIFKSQDGGATWRQSGLAGFRTSVLASSQVRPSTLFTVIDGRYSSGEPNVQRSTDGGVTWILLSNSPKGSFSLACDQVNPNLIYAAASSFDSAGYTNAIHKSIDGGNSWTKQIEIPIPLSTFTLAANQGAVFVGTDYGVLVSRNEGTTWSRTSVTTAADNIAIDPNDPKLVYANADRLYKSMDGGFTWSVALEVRQFVQCLAIVAGAGQTVYVGASSPQNGFVSKWSPDGKQLLYSTYLGGSYYDVPAAIAVDQSGNAFVAGYTYSLDFPVTANGIQKRHAGEVNGFVVKISADGDKLLYSTFLGGSKTDIVNAIALDGAGAVHLTGYASSADFPVTTGAQQGRLLQNCTPALPGAFNAGDAFATKIDMAGSRLVYSTFLGGSCGDHGLGIAVDNSGSATIVGVTDSPDFPATPNALQPKYNKAYHSGFLARLTPQGSISYDTFLGGANAATAEAVAVDSVGNVYVSGSSVDALPSSTPKDPSFGIFAVNGPRTLGFPYLTPGAAYVMKLDSSNWTQTYFKATSTTFAGAKSIATDAIGRVWTTGRIGSSRGNFSEEGVALFEAPFQPTVHPFQVRRGDSFVTQLSADGSTILFSSYVDNANAIAVDTSGNSFLLGGGLRNGAQLTRLDADVQSPVTVEEPQSLLPTLATGYAPGQFLVITGTGLGPDTEIPAQLIQGKLSTSLGGTSVLFDGVAAPMLSVKSDKVVCIVPSSFKQDMQLISNMGKSNSVRLPNDYWAISVAAVLNPDGTPNSPQKPAAPGSIVTLFVTGMGQTDPPMRDGEINKIESREYLFGASGAIDIGVNKVQAKVVYQGAAPNQVSAVNQINFVVPENTPTGKYQARIGFFSEYYIGIFPLNVSKK